MEDCTNKGHAGNGPIRKPKLRMKTDFRSSTELYLLSNQMPAQHKPICPGVQCLLVSTKHGERTHSIEPIISHAQQWTLKQKRRPHGELAFFNIPQFASGSRYSPSYSQKARHILHPRILADPATICNSRCSVQSAVQWSNWLAPCAPLPNANLLHARYFLWIWYFDGSQSAPLSSFVAQHLHFHVSKLFR